MVDWTHVMPAVSAAFIGSFVEVVEAFTIVLAVGTVRGWRPALQGAGAGLALLAALVVLLGPLFNLVPLHALQFVIGVLLLLFGMRWLRKAILRSAGVIGLHDESEAFNKETAELKGEFAAHATAADWLAMAAAFKAVVLEGVEVVFIVLAVGAANGMLVPASLGALAAATLVLLIGLAVHRPLAQVPENTLKFVVGVMLSAYGTFWVIEGLGGSWPGADLAIVGLAAGFWLVALAAVRWIKQRRQAASGVRA
jgi:Ca2+/H+ antiporter, TMEM165/GDT1 family